MIDRKEVGERLRNLRGDKSREEVAIAIGVTAQAISNYEIGIRTPSDDIKVNWLSISTNPFRIFFIHDGQQNVDFYY